MKQALIIFICSFLSLAGLAQRTAIKGKVVDLKGRPIAGASISIANSYDGATSDSIGFFSFATTDTGSQTITISCMGYKAIDYPVVLDGSIVSLTLTLKEAPNELTAVVITAGSFEASDAKKVTILKPLDIVTTASANADVAAAMRTLPGTQQVGESAELFVRGGAGYETRQYIDGTVVANPFFGQAPDIASRGRFSPFLFKGTIFSTGGYSALYGQALSSALILESIDLPDRSQASASFSPLFVGGQYQHLGKEKKSSWGVSAGYANLALYFGLVPQRPDYFKAPEVVNGDFNFRIKTSATGILKFYTSIAGNQLGLRNPDIDSGSLKNAFALENLNIYSNISYKERLANRLVLKAAMSFSQNHDIINQDVTNDKNEVINTGLPWYIRLKQFDLDATSRLLQGRAVLDYKLGGLSGLRGGAEYWYSEDVSRYQLLQSRLQDHFQAVFAEADIYLSNKLAARAGLRAEHSSLLGRTNLAPRTSLAYKWTGGAQLSFDYGIFYQKPLNQYLWLQQSLPYMRADHYIFTYQKIMNNRVFRTQVFHKEYKQLTKISPDTSATGDGYARGIEFFWRDKITFKNFDYWVTYSYLDTRRNYLNYPASLRPTFAANHTANLVVKRYFQKLKTQFNINYQFATGRPYYDFALDAANQKWIIRDQGKTIAYNNLSFSINYITNVGKAFGVLVFSMNNTLNSKQVFGYNYSHDGQNKVEINPPAPRFLFLGFFLSWGTDRTQDAINNNL